MNGLKAEEVFREALQKAGFWVLWHPDLDHEHQVDCVLGAPPGMRCFPQAVAVQFTTFPNNWDKRARFACASATLSPRRAFVEVTLTQNREFGPELLQPLMAAMLALLYAQRTQPALALVRVSANEFAVNDLEEELRHHIQLVAVPTDQRFRGRITYWKQAEGYGFITAVIPCSDERQGTVSFFVHRSKVTQEALEAVQSFDGHIPWNKHVPVSFTNGGMAQGRNRPSTLDVRLVNETTASLALVKA